jgi:translation initiation factor 3 subunit I
VRLWHVQSGKCLKVWDFNTAVKRVEFNEDGSQLLAVTEKRMGFLGTIVVLDIKLDIDAEQSDEKSLVITCEDSKATVAGWSYMSKYIIAGHEDGTVSQYDAKVGFFGEQDPKEVLTIIFSDRRAARQCPSP